MCRNFDTPARTAVIRSIKADACIYGGTTKGIPSRSASIRVGHRTGENVEIIGCAICADVRNNSPIGLRIIPVLNKFCFVSSGADSCVSDKLIIFDAVQFINTGCTRFNDTELGIVVLCNTNLLRLGIGIPTPIARNGQRYVMTGYVFGLDGHLV